MPMPPKDSPSDHEANLFAGASPRAQELYAQSKRVRRLAARRAWWNEHGKQQPSATEQMRGPSDIET